MSDQIILFRYHKAYDVCIQKLELLKNLNPDVQIHGLYGGEEQLEDLPADLTKLFTSNWSMPLDDPYYKWKNGDLCARWWFRDHGKNIEFDHAYFLEWDMLLIKPLKDIYGPLEKDTNYGTVFADFAKIQEVKHYWMKGQYGVETDQLIDYLANRNTPVEMEKLLYPIMGGTAFCRNFLEQYINCPVPSYTNDEVRLTFFSAAFGIPFVDNGIKSNPKNIYFSDNEVLSEKDIDLLFKQNGDVIHPIRFIAKDIGEKLKLEVD